MTERKVLLIRGAIIPKLHSHLFLSFQHIDPHLLVKLEHIGIAVRDINAALRHYELLFDATPYKVEEVASEGVRTHFFDAGGTKIELLEATSPDSPIARFVEKRGPGLHHLAFSTENADSAWKRLDELGYRVLGDGPKPGADGKTIFFVHPSDLEGVLTEFCAE